MELFQTYLEKHSAGQSLIQTPPSKGLKYIVVIPSYLETSLENSLVSLFSAMLPANAIEVIVVINWPEDASAETIRISRELFDFTKIWMDRHSTEKLSFHIVQAGFIPRKKAGVGYARKTGMDEAIRRFNQCGQEDGIIISFDADTIAEINYFNAIEEHFRAFPDTDGCSVYFEHPLEGSDFSAAVFKAIIQYELYMRYYLHAIKYTGFPNAFYTVGSAFAVRAASYCRQGGMNIRQAGEDFYFLQKFFDLGNFSDLVKTKVIPSPRPSLRVPFGTGKAIDQLLNSNESLKSYNPLTFDILKEFFASVSDFHEQLTHKGKIEFSHIHPGMREYLENSGFQDEILNIYENSGNPEAFKKRFYRYFNMFRILKFSKHIRNTYGELPVRECAYILLQKTGVNPDQGMTETEMLMEFRRQDRLPG